MVHKEAASFQLFSKHAANVTPSYWDQLFHLTADESRWLVFHLVNSPGVFVQIRLTIARIPNGTGKVHIAHVKENRLRYWQVLSCELVRIWTLLRVTREHAQLLIQEVKHLSRLKEILAEEWLSMISKLIHSKMPSDHFLYCWVKKFEVPILWRSNPRTLTGLTLHFPTVLGPAVSKAPKVVLLDVIFPILTQSWN